MAYTKQGFSSGQTLTAESLNLMEQGIIDAQKSGSNIESGSGLRSLEQLCRENKVSEYNGVMSFKNSNTAALTDLGISEYRPFGGYGDHSASLCGHSSASGKHSMAINNGTVAYGEECFAQGYHSVAAGNGSFAGGSTTYAKGTNSVSLGDSTKATAECAVATGARNTSSGGCSYSSGRDNVASGECSAVFGQFNNSTEINQTVVGQFNDTTKLPNGFHSVFQVGAGNHNSERINALNIGQGGEIVIFWNNDYYSLNGILNIMNNTLNMFYHTEEVNYFEDAKMIK